MPRVIITAVVVFLLISSPLYAGTFSLHEAIEFAAPDDERLLMDLRIPDGRGPHPVILYLHSGAWIMGDRFGGPAIRQATRGYAVASIEYRLAPQHIWPAQVEDAKAAVRWLRANADRFWLDPDRIGVFGTSAGGHIGAVLGTSGEVAWLEGLELGNAQFSSRVKAVIDLYGPTDLLKMEEQKIPCIPLNGNDWFMPPSLLMGCPVQQCREWTATANPMTYITADDPPFLIMQGMLDCLVPWKQSVILHDALSAAGVSSQLVLLPRGEHGGSEFDRPEYERVIDEFLDLHLRGEVEAPKPKRRAVR
jgi:acetyl esterase/lipase